MILGQFLLLFHTKQVTGADYSADIAPPRGARPSAETANPPGDGNRFAKKRKASSGGEIANERQDDGLLEQPTIFDLRDTILDQRSKLDAKDATISRVQLQKNQAEIKHQTELNKAIERHLDITDKLKAENLHLKKKINSYKRQVDNLQQQVEDRDERILDLEKRLEHLDLAYTRPIVKQEVPNLVPDKDPKICNHPEYLHRNAPRAHKLYTWFQPTVEYLPGQGKVRVTNYGSTKHWDLGLCIVRFKYGRTCHIRGCEYRHEALTQDEQIYMSFLQPKGPEFLTMVTAKNIKHLNLVLSK